ncbi:MAG: ATP synthase subunit I [Rubrivivax sp.]|nr:ATP synthase subunit I [Pyrinomonadaceae bacterium]
MSESADNVREAGPEMAGEDPRAAERRIFRDTCVMVVAAVAVSVVLAPWRVTTGLLLGGALGVFNQHWLRTSVAAVFGDTPEGARPKWRAARYVLRYIVVAVVIAASVKLQLVSLVATLAGMCAVVAALLAEGFRQLYSAIVRREET